MITVNGLLLGEWRLTRLPVSVGSVVAKTLGQGHKIESDCNRNHIYSWFVSQWNTQKLSSLVAIF